MKLRKYQKVLVDRTTASLNDGHSTVLVSATGSGKSFMSASIIKQHIADTRNPRVWFLVHRRELVSQAQETLAKLDIDSEAVTAGAPTSKAPVVVAMVPTIMRRGDLPKASLVVFDECHHVASRSWTRCMNELKTDETQVLGLTATPVRKMSYKGERGLGLYFDRLVQGPQVKYLISIGALVKPLVYVPMMADVDTLKASDNEDYTPQDCHNVVQSITPKLVVHYHNFISNRKTVVCCATISHAYEVAEAFNDYGISAAVIHGKLPDDIRSRIIKDFERGKYKVLIQIGILNEGFDLPAIDALMLLRPTKSLSLHLQQVGRALRPASGKSAAYVLDYVGNNFRHGPADAIRYWSLETGICQRKTPVLKPREQAWIICEECSFVYPTEVIRCPCCGHQEDDKPHLPPPDIQGMTLAVDEEFRTHYGIPKRFQKHPAHQNMMTKLRIINYDVMELTDSCLSPAARELLRKITTTEQYQQLRENLMKATSLTDATMITSNAGFQSLALTIGSIFWYIAQQALRVETIDDLDRLAQKFGCDRRFIEFVWNTTQEERTS